MSMWQLQISLVHGSINNKQSTVWGIEGKGSAHIPISHASQQNDILMDDHIYFSSMLDPALLTCWMP